MERQTLNVDELALLFGVSRGSAYKWVRENKIPVLRLGRRLLVPKVALDRMLLETFDRIELNHTSEPSQD